MIDMCHPAQMKYHSATYFLDLNIELSILIRKRTYTAVRSVFESPTYVQTYVLPTYAKRTPDWSDSAGCQTETVFDKNVEGYPHFLN